MSLLTGLMFHQLRSSKQDNFEPHDMLGGPAGDESEGCTKCEKSDDATDATTNIYQRPTENNAKPRVRRHFGIIDKVNRKDVPVRECTQELLYSALQSAVVIGVKRRVMELKRQRDGGEIQDEEYNESTRVAKSNLPALTPFGTYQGGVRKGELLLPGGFNMMDYDHVEDIEAFKMRLLQRLRQTGLIKHVAFIQYSIRGEGLHIMFVNPDNMDTVSGQAWFATKIGEPGYDEQCKDDARPMFLSVMEDLIHIDKDLLFGEGLAAPHATLEEQMAAADLLREKKVHARKDGQEQRGKVREAEWDDHDLPTQYMGVPYQQIVETFVSRVMGGEPAVGSRHNNQMLLMLQLSGICGNNPALLFRITPEWGQTQADRVALARWVCERADGGLSCELRNIICKLMPPVVDDSDGDANAAADAGEAVAAADVTGAEEWSEKEFYENGRRELQDRLYAVVPNLPAALRRTLEPVEKEMQLPILLSVLPIIGAAADGVKITDLSGKERPMALSSVIDGRFASNKSWCTDAAEIWLHVFKEEDNNAKMRYRAEMKEWKLKKESEKDEFEKPRCPRRVFPVDFTRASFLDWAEDCPDHILISFGEETDLATKTNKAGVYSDKRAVYRLAYDWGILEAARHGKDSKSGSAQVKLNISLIGTHGQFKAFFPSEDVSNGMASRFLTYRLTPPDVFGDVPQYPQWTEADRLVVDTAVRRLFAEHGTAQTPLARAAIEKWQMEAKAFAKDHDADQEMAQCSFRSAPNALKVAALGMMLTEDGHETEATVELALIIAQLNWIEQYHNFAPIMKENRAKEEMEDNEGFKPMKDYIYDQLPDEFTFDDYLKIRPQANKKSFYMYVSRLFRAGKALKVRKGVWQKIKRSKSA